MRQSTMCLYYQLMTYDKYVFYIFVPGITHSPLLFSPLATRHSPLPL
jgi:hypothetical protein